MKRICDVVFEGGGMRGIGHAGAVARLEREGYSFRRASGASAGAIAASLLVAGYTANEMYEILKEVNFEKFKHFKLMTGNPTGIYRPDLLEAWLAKLLEKKGVHTFADVGDRLKITASDVTDGKILVLPDDLVKFGIDPKKFQVATAVRMSLSIPIYFKAYELRDLSGRTHHIVDGGLFSNYPAWILDKGGTLDIPVFGFRFIRHPDDQKERGRLASTLSRIVNKVAEFCDQDIPISGDPHRTIYIDTRVNGKMVGSTEFNLSPEGKSALYKNGYDSASAFLDTWDFAKWHLQFRN